MKVFISYGDIADQITALRLQALAAVNGLTVYVPPANTRQALLLAPESAQKLKDAEVILGVIGNRLTEACRLELNTAIASGRATIVMCYPPVAQQLQQFFGRNLVVIDPANPDLAEQKIVQYLKAVNAQKNTMIAVLALATLALGLLIFAPAD